MRAFAQQLDALQPQDVSSEILESLGRYLRYPTVNPPGHVGEAVDFLASVLSRERIPVTILEPFADKKILIARLSGRVADRGLIYLGHSDVVPAEGAWTFDPFGGVQSDGYVWGRGALDMKGMTIMQLWAMVALRRSEVELENDLTLIVVPDEEQGGFQGAEWLTAIRPDLCRGRWLLNEGGMGVRLPDLDRTAFICSVGEKGPLWLRLTTNGVSGHSAIPNDHNALEILTAGLARLFDRPLELQIEPRHRRMMDLLGVEGPVAYKTLTSRLYLRPQLADTVSLTVLEGGAKQNVIPAAASAILDCRLLPGRSPESFLADLKSWLADDRIGAEILVQRDASSSPEAGPLLQVLETVVNRHFPDATFLPYVAPYFTDSMFFRKLGIEAYGLMPILIEEQDLSRIHGVDERISCENLVRGTKLLTEIALRMCEAAHDG